MGAGLAELRDGLDSYPWTGLECEGLASLPKNDWRKAIIDLGVKRETAMRHSWISDQLSMGVGAGVSRCTRIMAERIPKDKKMRKLYEKITKSKFVA